MYKAVSGGVIVVVFIPSDFYSLYWLPSGSVGDAISVMKPDVYVSDDGGYSWLTALKGPHHYAILDSGGLLVAVEHTTTQPINQIK